MNRQYYREAFIVVIAIMMLAGCSQQMKKTEKRTPIIDFDYTISMNDSLQGWAFGEEILITDDGGRSWLNVTPYSNEKNLTSNHLFILDTNTAWIAVKENKFYQIYKTTDRGDNWIQSNIKFDFEKTKGLNLFFLNEHEGWILETVHAGLGYSVMNLFHTTNGGQEWTDYTTTQFLNEDGNKQSISFKDNKLGWIGVHDWLDVDDSHASEGIPYMYLTENGGYNWRKYAIPYTSNYSKLMFSASAPQFFNNQDGIFTMYTISDNEIEEQVQLFYYKSSNGGLDWEQHKIATAIDAELFQDPIYQFIDLNTGWVLYDAQSVYHTSNGKEWHTIFDLTYFPDEQYTSILSFTFSTEDKGWIIVSSEQGNQILVTDNGGQTWTKLLPYTISS